MGEIIYIQLPYSDQNKSEEQYCTLALVCQSFKQVCQNILFTSVPTSVCYDRYLLGVSPLTFSLPFQCQSLVIFIHLSSPVSLSSERKQKMEF